MAKVVKGTVTIDGQVYKAFEMYSRGPWMIVRGTSFSDPVVVHGLRVKTASGALKMWLHDLDNKTQK